VVYDVTPEQAARALAARTADVKAAGDGVSIEPLMRATRQAANVVRQHASRSGSPISIRVSQRANGVRVTVTGRDAARYRALLSQQLATLMPAAKADIHAQIKARAAR
jgi:hypothetical protein